jgi:HEAT repeat protein
MGEPDIEMLRKEVLSGQPAEQIEAIQRLIELKVHASVPLLIETLRSPNAMVRSVAAQALGALKGENAGSTGAALVKLLKDPDAIVRSEAVDALGILRFVPAIEPIKHLLLNDPAALVRASAAESLGDLGDARFLPELELALGDADEAVRAYAANSIGLLGTSQLLPKLQRHVVSEHSLSVTAELHGARYRLGAREDLDALLELLNTADEKLAPNVVNILEDLTRRNLSPSLTADAARIRNSLTRLEKRMPHLSADAQRVLARLAGMAEEGHQSGKIA